MFDTIAAISTALANSALAIVRVSGEDAIKIVNSLFLGKNLTNVKTKTLNYGHIVDKGNFIDEVMIGLYRAPATFTGEDLVEITCHGGLFVTQKILSLIIEKGARLAEPGEFTKRAFLNGRIDLTQAEAVMDLIEAQTEASLKMASNALLGKTKDYINLLRQKLLKCILEIEVNIDYPEYEDEKQITNELLRPTLHDLICELESILKKAEVGTLIKHGIKTAIIGKPNVGKSSLLNALLAEERAIVTDIAGTTRDTIEASLKLGGLVLRLIDTAGIRETQDYIENIGIDRTKKTIAEADLVILVFDNSSPIDQDDLTILKLTEKKKRLIIINKQDLDSKIDYSILPTYLLLSSFNKQDIAKLEKLLVKTILHDISLEIDETYLGSIRQITKIKSALYHLNEALKALLTGYPVDIVNVDIRLAYDDLSSIIGEATSESLPDELFKRFCLGK